MSTFTYDVIEPLAYDFTQIPHNSGQGFCTGQGVIPEPTQDHLIAYGEEVKALFNMEDGDTAEDVQRRLAEELKDKSTKQQKAAADKASRKMLEITAKLCQQSPSADQLGELPPRARNAFLKWVQKEVANPEV